jgi:hypothetical protein
LRQGWKFVALFLRSVSVSCPGLLLTIRRRAFCGFKRWEENRLVSGRL